MKTVSVSKLKRQSGITLVIFTIGMVVIMGMAGLALDLSHAYVNKTRLQNALDAAALSGAKTLLKNGKDAVAQMLAETDTKNTFDQQLAQELVAADLDPTVEFSDELRTFLGAPAGVLAAPQYVRVRLANFQMPTWFAHVLPGVNNFLTVGGSAVAGPSPELGPEVCNVVPFLLCDESADPASPDTNCDDDTNGDDIKDCYGFNLETILRLKSAAPSNTDDNVGRCASANPDETSFDQIATGNFQLLDLDCPDTGGASCVRKLLAGEYPGCVTIGEESPTETQPGNMVGPVAQGLNTRFDQYQGGQINPQDHPPAPYIDECITHDEYQACDSTNCEVPSNPPGEASRRVVGVPVAQCPDPAGTGKTEMNIVGVACMFLIEKATQHGGDQFIFGELTTGCEAEGEMIENPPAPPAAGPTNFRVILYDDPDSSAS